MYENGIRRANEWVWLTYSVDSLGDLELYVALGQDAVVVGQQRVHREARQLPGELEYVELRAKDKIKLRAKHKVKLRADHKDNEERPAKHKHNAPLSFYHI